MVMTAARTASGSSASPPQPCRRGCRDGGLFGGCGTLKAIDELDIVVPVPEVDLRQEPLASVADVPGLVSADLGHVERRDEQLEHGEVGLLHPTGAASSHVALDVTEDAAVAQSVEDSGMSDPPELLDTHYCVRPTSRSDHSHKRAAVSGSTA